MSIKSSIFSIPLHVIHRSKTSITKQEPLNGTKTMCREEKMGTNFGIAC